MIDAAERIVAEKTRRRQGGRGGKVQLQLVEELDLEQHRQEGRGKKKGVAELAVYLRAAIRGGL